MNATWITWFQIGDRTVEALKDQGLKNPDWFRRVAPSEGGAAARVANSGAVDRNDVVDPRRPP